MKSMMKKVIALATVGTMLLSSSLALAAPAVSNTAAPVVVASNSTVYGSFNLESYTISVTNFSGSFAFDFDSIEYDAPNGVSYWRFFNGSVKVQQYIAATGEYVDLGEHGPSFVGSGGTFDTSFRVNLSKGDRLLFTCRVSAYIYDSDAYPFQYVEGYETFTVQWQ